VEVNEVSERTFLVFLGVSISISLVSCAASGPFTTATSHSFEAAPDPQIDGWYFGYSEVPAGRIAWFLQLDSRVASGKIYLPPQVLNVRNLVITRDGKVRFQFGDNDQARFDGDLNAGITGKFFYSNGRSFETHLTRVEEKWLTQECAVFGGLYSNVRFVEEAGDLIGTELLLIPQADGLGGILTLYEGVPGNIYALTNVQMKDHTIAFAIVTSRGIENFAGELSSDNIVIRKIVNERPEPDAIALPKQRLLVDLSSSQTTVP
jgi:hypothetical protein